MHLPCHSAELVDVLRIGGVTTTLQAAGKGRYIRASAQRGAVTRLMDRCMTVWNICVTKRL